MAEGTAAVSTANATGKLGLTAMTAMVVGSMVGAGVFQLPSRFASETGVYGAAISWAIAGTGMLALAFVFQNLSRRKPNLDNGVYVYAREGFGVYPGFLSAVGFWASACAGNAFYWVLIMTTVSQLVPDLEPILGSGDTWWAFAVSAVAVWGFFFLIRNGVKEAAWINTIVTVAKLVPLLLFLVLVIFFFKSDVFADNLTGGYDLVGGDSLFQQVQGTMLITVFVFLGIEGASVYSRHAKKRSDVGRATVLGFLSVLALFASISILSYGILPREEIAALQQPSIGGVLESVTGEWGGTLIRVGLIVSVLGAYLAWQLLAADVVYAAAKDKDFPPYFERLNKHGAPESAVLWTSILVTAILFAVQFIGNALDFTLDLTAALALLPFALASAYALKIALTHDGYPAGDPGRTRELVVAAISTVYTLFLLWAAGYLFLFLSCVLLAPATFLYYSARRKQGETVFTRPGLTIFAVVLVGAIVGIVLMATGAIQIEQPTPAEPPYLPHQ
ncbi:MULTISPECIES: basic amino acid/polyamine antiporter [unclassified Rhodococcus (in: high G+C Gram-positive bacteria)]|uniref:basic amino acid/polyamine antiporter n=1 Tax=unclassified Rhodococcus (in: high G+C Gram-positive bacteria) TaxID=192944 RepID=UPI00163A237C|nr:MULTISPECIES: basic amino acid/polyamine antiporter [unclassified Rhodococcus (in: high G+C Gram-positive bacteria)]MBC2644419.1 amino acid permease [Rhodococcus sp. 3A]MBC2897889.1 amino acid permease [Rhodococcus sp. 4CII]